MALVHALSRARTLCLRLLIRDGGVEARTLLAAIRKIKRRLLEKIIRFCIKKLYHLNLHNVNLNYDRTMKS